MNNAQMSKLISHVTSELDAHEEELTRLDQAIGDGDHGINMKRGSAAILEVAEDIAALPFGAAMKKVGITLVMSIGGASGPLYGTLAISMGDAAEKCPQNTTDLAAVLNEGIADMKLRGKSDTGAKTMLDVLVPVQKALASSREVSPFAMIRRVADFATAATGPMLATKGRAAFLGERSIGHIDPGARSSNVMINAICDVLEKRV